MNTHAADPTRAPDLVSELVDEHDGAARLVGVTGQLAQGHTHEPSLTADLHTSSSNNNIDNISTARQGAGCVPSRWPVRHEHVKGGGDRARPCLAGFEVLMLAFQYACKHAPDQLCGVEDLQVWLHAATPVTTAVLEAVLGEVDGGCMFA